MKEIILVTKGLVTLVDDEDFEIFDCFRWRAKKNRSGIIYAMRHLPSYPSTEESFLHREILKITDSKVWIDHKDGNGLNNQRHNLRLSSASQNGGNSKKHSNNTSGYKGVIWHHNRWCASIKVNYKRLYLGGYINIEDAARAYDEAAIRHFGEFAKLNFPK